MISGIHNAKFQILNSKFSTQGMRDPNGCYYIYNGTSANDSTENVSFYEPAFIRRQKFNYIARLLYKCQAKEFWSI